MAAELAIGIIALAGLFNNVVGCFVYVRISSTFGRDLRTCELTLKHQHLHLSRWGSALGLDMPSDMDPQQLPNDHPIRQSGMTEADLNELSQLLRQLAKLFADAEATAAQFSGHIPDSEPGDTTTQDAKLTKLYAKLSDMSLVRHKLAKHGRTAWSLYKRDEFDRLISSISKVIAMIDDSSFYFRPAQRRLAADEVAQIRDDASLGNGLALLNGTIAPETDKILADAIAKAMEEQSFGTKVGFLYLV